MCFFFKGFRDYVDAITVMKYLIEKGANVDSTSDNKSSLLHFAAAASTLEMVKYLVEERNAGTSLSFLLSIMFSAWFSFVQNCFPKQCFFGKAIGMSINAN